MIRKEHRTDHQCQKLAFIEACIDVYGYYNNKFMSQVFGNHEKDAARVTAKYKKINPEALDKQSRSLIPSATYQRKVLKPHTDARAFIIHLETIHGSNLDEQEEE